MENLYTHTRFQRLWDSKWTQTVVFTLFLMMLACIAYLFINNSALLSKNSDYQNRIESLEPLVEENKKMSEYIISLEEDKSILEDSLEELETAFLEIEKEILKLEENLVILSDVKDKTNQ